MHIVLWQNVLCTFDSSFFAVFTHQALATDIAKAIFYLKVGTLQNWMFSIDQSQNFGGANYTANHTKGR